MLRLATLCALMTVSAGYAADTVVDNPVRPRVSRSLGGERWQDTFNLEAPAAELRLSRSHLLWGSERVYLDGHLLTPGRDYQLDLESGGLRILQPAPAGAVIQVLFAAPRLLQGNQGPGEAHSPTGTTLETRLRAALAAAPLGPSVSLQARGGQNDAASLRDELLSGLRLTQHADRLGDARSNSAAVTYFRADPVDPQSAAAAREEFSGNLDLRPSGASRLRFLSAFSRESLFTEHQEQHERQRLQFEQTLGQSTASLLWDRRRSDGLGTANALDALSLSLVHPFTRNTRAEGFFSFEDSLYRGRETESALSLRQQLGSALSAQGGLQFRTSEFSGNTVETGLTVVAQPNRASDLTLALRQADSERYGHYQRLSADLNASLTRRLQLTGEVSRRTSEQYGSIDTFGLGLAARPNSFSVLETAFSESTSAVLGRERTQTVRLGLDPSAALKLQLGYDRTQSSEEGASQNGLWILTVGGERYFRVEGYAAAHRPTDSDPYSDSLYRLEVRPVEPLALSAQLRKVLLDQEDRSVAGVGASLRLARLLELSAGYRQPALGGEFQPGLSGNDVRLSLLPHPGLRLFGQYSVRPEDERGGLLDQIHRSLGLETRIGSFGLQGTLTRMEGLLSPTPGQRVDLLASLNLGEATRLYGGIRTQDPLLLDQQSSRIYRLGITQNAGNAFLLLEGQFGWAVDATGKRSWSPEDGLAQARIGLRF